MNQRMVREQQMERLFLSDYTQEEIEKAARFGRQLDCKYSHFELFKMAERDNLPVDPNVTYLYVSADGRLRAVAKRYDADRIDEAWSLGYLKVHSFTPGEWREYQRIIAADNS